MSKYLPPFSNDELEKLMSNRSPEQLAWLSGYLWGVVAKGASPVASSVLASGEAEQTATTPTVVAKTITLLSASQTGNARGVANALSHDLERLGLTVKHCHVGDYKFKKIDQEQYLILITSTQGEGEPPEEALPFYTYLLSKKAPQLTQLHYAVLGLGDSSYVNFCLAGKQFDARLAELGGTRLCDRVDADVDFQSSSDSWRQTVVDRLSQILASASDVAVVASESEAIVVENSRYQRDNPFLATVIANQQITARHSDRETRHIELDLSDSGIRYQPGDTLGVWYENDALLVEQLLNITQLAGETEVELHGIRYALRQALIEKVELTQNSPSFVKNYAGLVVHRELSELVADLTELRKFCQTTPIIDTIKRYPGTISAQQVIDSLRPLTPRFYSIASAQDEVGAEVHLTVNVVRYWIDDQLRTGGASYFLAQQIVDQSQIKIFVEPNDNFRLPVDDSVPMIMIAAGTGIAPFRAFLQQRACQSAGGKNWLIFGNPHFTADFLYQLEWQTYLKEGLLSRVDLAWSRDQAHKIYVQDKLLAQAADIWQWLQQGAYIYVCGDAQQMAKAVNQALLQIISQQGGYSDEQAKHYLNELRVQKRYQRDIY